MLFGHEDELSLNIRLKSGLIGDGRLDSKFIGKMLAVLIEKHGAVPFGSYRSPGGNFPAVELLGGRVKSSPDVFSSLVHRGVYLPNLGRIYEEAVRPYFEVATITTSDPFELYRLTRRGQQIAGFLSREVSDDGREVKCFNATSDRRGKSCGMHLNFCVSREFFWRIYERKSVSVPEDSADIALYSREAQDLISFRVLATILRGAGKVGSESYHEPAHYQISERSDFVARLVNSNTSTARPIINFRDEPHADANLFGRLHVVNGEGNRSPWAFAFDAGLLAILLEALSADAVKLPWHLKNPVETLHNLSRDLNFEKEIPVYYRKEHKVISAKPLDLLEQVLFELYKFTGYARLPVWCDGLVAEARRVVALLARGELSEPTTMLDWLMKKRFLENYLEKKLGLDPGEPDSFRHPRIQQLDLHYHRLDLDGWKMFAEYSGARDFDKFWLPYGTPTEPAFWKNGMPIEGRPYLFAKLLSDESIRHRVSVLDWDKLDLRSESGETGTLIIANNPYLFGRKHLGRILKGRMDFRKAKNRDNLIAAFERPGDDTLPQVVERSPSIFGYATDGDKKSGGAAYRRELLDMYDRCAKKRRGAPRTSMEESPDLYERSLGILVDAGVTEPEREDEANETKPSRPRSRVCGFGVRLPR